MSIQPIDLQTLFMKMNQVGKEKAQNAEHLVHQQIAQGEELEEKQRQAAKRVNESDGLQEGPEVIHDDDEKERKEPGKGNDQDDDQGKPQTSSGKKYEQLKDPHLGNKIDLSG